MLDHQIYNKSLEVIPQYLLPQEKNFIFSNHKY